MSNPLLSPIFLIAMCIALGQLFGKVGYKHFKLGSSATLFVGLIFSFLAGQNNWEVASVPGIVFDLALIAFIVAVGLRASTSILSIVKKHGFKFAILSFIVTGIGALSTFIFIQIFSGSHHEIIGTYVGALTSSPGLATALEVASRISDDVGSAVGVGYAIAYVPGVLIVIFFSQIMANFKRTVVTEELEQIVEKKTKSFNIFRFAIVIVVGLLLGSISVPLPGGFNFSLGTTGGVLISALVLGAFVKSFTFNEDALNVITDVGLNGFLAIVGLNYGFQAFQTVQEAGVLLLIIGTVTGILAITLGYVFGRYILKLDHEVLVGGLCGAMTSTPGLAAAIEAFDNDDVVVGYGAAYPFALIGMIIFTSLLF